MSIVHLLLQETSADDLPTVFLVGKQDMILDPFCMMACEDLGLVAVFSFTASFDANHEWTMFDTRRDSSVHANRNGERNQSY